MVLFGSKGDLLSTSKMIEEAGSATTGRWSRDGALMSDFGPGSPFWLPNGMALRNALIDWHEMQARFGYQGGVSELH